MGESVASIESSVEGFARQFERDGDGYLYRASMKGAAYRTTQAERDAFVARFRRDAKIYMASAVGGIFAALALLFWLSDGNASNIAIIAVLLISLACFLLTFMHAWRRPQRVLAQVTPVAPALSREMARANALGRITYGQLALAAGLSIFVAVLHSETRLWWGLPVVLLPLSGVQAWRKWRSERGSAGSG